MGKSLTYNDIYLRLNVDRKGMTPSFTFMMRSSTSEDVRTLLMTFAVCTVLRMNMNAAAITMMKNMMPTM